MVSSRLQPCFLDLKVAGPPGGRQVLRDVRIVIADQLGRNLEDIQPDNTFVDIGADSLDTVEIMMALEEKFELTLEEEGAEQVRTVDDAAELIAKQIDSL
eukprot:jgi/Botrbrau1/6252/Bobra.0129s0006.1